MPVPGRIITSRQARLISLAKRCVVVLFVALCLAFAFDQLGPSIGSLSTLTGAQQRLPINQNIAISDCTFLKDPESFRGMQARHRRDVSRLSVSVTDSLEGQAGSLVPAQDVPRNNLIDDILFDRMSRAGIVSASLCTDAEFMRRVMLDLTGRIPTPDEVKSFLQDTNPHKRDALVDRLIATPEYVDKWTMFFGDLYKNNSNATNITRYIVGRETFYQYIRDSITQNKSYAQIATELITATGDNYTNGAVNYIVGGNVPMGPAQDTMDGLAVVVATNFLGLSSMDCLLCHDGARHLDAINLWGSKATRAEAWGMSAFFARTGRRFERANAQVNYGKYTVTENAAGEYQLNTNSGNRQTRAPINGRNTVAPNYMFGGGGLNTGENRRQALARYVTVDPQFARAIVNYIWEELMVEALVSPSNTFDPARLSPGASLPEGWSLQPANPELLEALSQEFKRNNYDIRYLISLIAKSSAYQLSSKYPGEWKLEYVPYYARKFVRRLDAEEIHDAIVRATGIFPVTTFRDLAGQNQTVLGYPLLGDDGNKMREVTWAMQLPEPLEPRQRGDVSTFLNSFLRGNRDSNQRVQDSSILQSLNLMNNAFVGTRIHQANRITNLPNTPEIPSTVRRLLSDPNNSPDQIIEQLYLYTLSRYPTAEEKAKILPYFASLGRVQATESLQWVLINKVDFIFNY